MKRKFQNIVGWLYIFTAIVSLIAAVVVLTQSRKFASSDDLGQMASLFRENAKVLRNAAKVLGRNAEEIQSSYLKTSQDLEAVVGSSLETANTFLENTKKSYKVPIPGTDWHIAPLSPLTPFAEKTADNLNNVSNSLKKTTKALVDFKSVQQDLIKFLNNAAELQEVCVGEIEDIQRIRQTSDKIYFFLAILIALCLGGSGVLKILPDNCHCPTDVQH